MPIYQFQALQPSIDPSAFVFDSAVIIGQATLKANTSVWANAVIRADNAPIIIEEGSNIQECSVLHVDIGIPLCVGKFVSIGHQAMLHGCTIGEGSLVGMQAIVMNKAVVGKNCIIGSGAIIPEGKIIPDNSLVIGVAKIVRTLNADDLQQNHMNTLQYIERAKLYASNLKRL